MVTDVEPYDRDKVGLCTNKAHNYPPALYHGEADVPEVTEVTEVNTSNRGYLAWALCTVAPELSGKS